jgi:protein-S-isoprenylcysteine O-methyltransferase Ste14
MEVFVTASSIKILLYFILWALAHSALASLTVKGWARQAFGLGVERWYRLAFVSFAGLSLFPLLWMMVSLPDHDLYVIPAPWSRVMQTGRLAAFFGLGVATLQAGTMHFLGIAQLFAQKPAKTGQLQVRGFFRYTRHPLYLFSSLLLWLSPTMSVNTATLYALMVLYFIIGSIHEEQLLVDEYGEAYEAYRQQVPRFIPWPGRVYRDE